MNAAIRLRRLVIAGWALTLVLLLAIGALLVRNLVGDSAGLASLWAEAPPERPTEVDVTLYFAASGAEGLIAETRTLPVNDTDVQQLQTCIEALIAGPRRGLTPTLDGRVRLLNAYILEGVAILDFSAELQTTHGGGSVNELLTIYSVVNTVAANFPTVRSVKLLVEGEEIDTLGGHVDTRRAFRANPDWLLPEVRS